MSLRLDPADFEYEGRLIPDYMHQSIRDYLIDHKLDPDDFLAAVLVNDLRRAVGSADWNNRWLIPVYVAYFHNHAPYTCWGSVERVRAWVNPRIRSLPPEASDEQRAIFDRFTEALGKHNFPCIRCSDADSAAEMCDEGAALYRTMLAELKALGR